MGDDELRGLGALAAAGDERVARGRREEEIEGPCQDSGRHVVLDPRTSGRQPRGRQGGANRSWCVGRRDARLGPTCGGRENRSAGLTSVAHKEPQLGPGDVVQRLGNGEPQVAPVVIGRRRRSGPEPKRGQRAVVLRRACGLDLRVGGRGVRHRHTRRHGGRRDHRGRGSR